ncbi:uncharacterized protein LOC122369067 [Amphibalanus amphitrite]|uniref:uncharacterized protein LOC122369067 n=1 Tax=Amphibalanus amphitrite TaxID=1232801 RepID=UPI001C913C74|nr:uncharacterized protein LOC122369067 [Amphibalanus amphitrite]XP_043199386.1 uncharacterized protein LOC122369067 [Amphibalanus amphitrite]
MAPACGRLAAVSWLAALVQLTVCDVTWPSGVTDLQLWDVLDDLEPAISGHPIRIADLAIRMVDMEGQRFGGNQSVYWQRHGYTQCKCRVGCLASRWCVAFEFDSSNGWCQHYSNRGGGLEAGASTTTTMQFKMLNAGVGDACQIDLECSRQTLNATCVPDAATGGATCQCPGDHVPHHGACVDPMSLTTTVATTTTTTVTTTTVTTTTTAPAETTTDAAAAAAAAAAATTTAPPVPVTDGAVTLADMSVEAEWPCDAANTDVDVEACSFMAQFAVPDTAPEMWRNTLAGSCDLARGRCKFPTVLSSDSSDVGPRRIEGWRSAGHFFFSSPDFLSPPPEITDAYDAGPATTGDRWRYDCSTYDGTSTVLTGILGVAREDKYDNNIPRDMDLIQCTRFLDIYLQVDPAVGAVLDIAVNGEYRCPANHVVTGVWSLDKHFLSPEKAKCSRLVSGTVNVDDPACVMTGRHAGSSVAIYWNACVQDSGPFVVTGLRLSDVTVNAESKQWELRCCPVTGPATTTTVS